MSKILNYKEIPDIFQFTISSFSTQPPKYHTYSSPASFIWNYHLKKTFKNFYSARKKNN